MGNGLWKAIEREQWMQVKAILSDERSHPLVRTQTYSIRRQIFPKVETDEQVWILHMLLWKAAPLEIVQLVLDIDPSQLTRKSLPSEELPIHFAAMNPVPGFNMDALELVLKRNPEALKRKSLRGQTPLHIACESLQPIWFIKKLVAKEPSTIDIRDAHDQTPWDILQIKSGSLLYYNNRLKAVLGPGDTIRADVKLSGTSSPTRKKQKIPLFQDTTASSRYSDDLGNTTGRTMGPTISSSSCILCTENAAEWAIVPCGHLCLCQDCALDYSNSVSSGCPFCEQPLERCIQIIADVKPLSVSDHNSHIQ